MGGGDGSGLLLSVGICEIPAELEGGSALGL